MTMPPHLRKLALTAHVTASVGWLGAVGAFLALAIAGLTSPDAHMVRAAYLGMDLTGWFVIVPLSFASLLTGLVQALVTPMGLVPAPLGSRETLDQRLCHDRLAYVHADAGLFRRHCISCDLVP